MHPGSSEQGLHNPTHPKNRTIDPENASSGVSGLEELCETLRKNWKVPGAALGLIQNNQVVFLEGFGLRDEQHDLPFTPDTLVRVASTTKSFTSALVAALVDRGLVEWDQPVRKYHPDFQMQDPFASAELTLEDMLCHRSGLPYHENLLATGVGRVLTGSSRGFRDNLIRRLRFFDRSSPFRTHFQYQDIIYTAVGGILERLTNRDYDRMVEEYLLEPLGMRYSTYSILKARESGLLAESYAEVEGEVSPMDFIDLSYLAPCAGLYSTTREMLTWVQFHMNDGLLGGQQLISRENMEWMHRAHMVVDSPDSLRSYATPELSYGQGWFRSLRDGHLMVSHGGSFNGHRTFMAFFPELGIGGVVLCNLNLTYFPELLLHTALDRLLGIDSTEKWESHFRGLENNWKERNKLELNQFLAGRNPDNSPGCKYSAYTGTYTHPGYGTFIVEESAQGLVQTYEERTFPLEPYNGETFATRFQSTENHLLHITMTFEQDVEGKVVAANVPLIPGIPVQRFIHL